MSPSTSTRRGPLPSLAILLPLLSLVAFITVRLHYGLPEPVLEGTNPITNQPQFSEANSRKHMQSLQDIGYRIVGTQECSEGRDYVFDQLKALQAQCDVVEGLECELELQVGSGSHRFNILEHDVLKSYSHLSNVIFTIHGKGDRSSSLLLNSHIDSQLPGPGAADDAIGVGIMIEIARILIQRDQSFNNSLVLLFNNAEESLQDGSHLFSTQWPLASTIKAVVNLEAAGSTGSSMLFQATSPQMVKAYSNVPYPHGTVLAADVFSSGIIGSDTDFGQFENYLDVVGLDTALVYHSYYYHTAKDTVENVEKGSTQHFGENTLAVVDELLGPNSELATIEKKSELGKQTTVYFSFFDKYFFHYELETARKITLVLYSISAMLVINLASWSHWPAYAAAFVGTFGSLVGALLGANLLALLMHQVLGKAMSWFANEFSSMVLYAPPAFLGGFFVQYLVSLSLHANNAAYLPHAASLAILFFNANVMLLCDLFSIRSGCMPMFLTASAILTILADEGLSRVRRRNGLGNLGLTHHILGQVVPTIVGVESVTITLGIFAPLTGRMGEKVPVEHIIASIVAILTWVFTPTATPFYHSFGPAFRRRSLSWLLVATLLSSWFFIHRAPFDARHPRRIFLEQEFNATSGEWTFHAAAMDSAPGVQEIFDGIHEVTEGNVSSPATLTPMNPYNPSWDSIYPVGNFFSTYQWPLSTPPETGTLPTINIKPIKDDFDPVSNIRSLSLQVDFPGLIWPALAFSAHILEWDFNTPPPDLYSRHHFKGASEYGHESYVVSFNSLGNEAIVFDYTGLVETGMWPNTAKERGRDTPGTARWELLSGHLKERYEDSLDLLMMTTVVGKIMI